MHTIRYSKFLHVYCLYSIQEKLGVAAEQNAKRYKTTAKAIIDSVNQVSGKIADIGFATEDATVGVTKLLHS